MKAKAYFTTVLVLLAVVLSTSDAWSGHFYSMKRSRMYRERYCASWYRFWGCSYWRYYWRTEYYLEYNCSPGWTHGGDQNCNIVTDSATE